MTIQNQAGVNENDIEEEKQNEVNEDYIFPDKMNFKDEENDQNNNAKNKIKFREIYLPLETIPTNHVKNYLTDTKSKSLTMHKFNMDAEKDENNELQFDKDRICFKLSEILNLVSN